MTAPSKNRKRQHDIERKLLDLESWLLMQLDLSQKDDHYERNSLELQPVNTNLMMLGIVVLCDP